MYSNILESLKTKYQFLINKTKRYNIKGRKFIGSPFKYYFTDIGLRNAKLNFSQPEQTHIMENIIYNELLAYLFPLNPFAFHSFSIAQIFSQKVADFLRIVYIP